MAKEVRIVKRVHLDGKVEYVIQKKCCLFFWLWVDEDGGNNTHPYSVRNRYHSLQEARANLCYFDGSKPQDTVVN